MRHKRRYHNGDIASLEPHEVFVFGSNLAGIHGAGAALHAKRRFGAPQGYGKGRMGKCYALPTKDRDIRTLPLDHIAHYVRKFIDHARNNTDETFFLTAIGCGLAGYSPQEIAPLFADASLNVVFPPEFKDVTENKYST